MYSKHRLHRIWHYDSGDSYRSWNASCAYRDTTVHLEQMWCLLVLIYFSGIVVTIVSFISTLPFTGCQKSVLLSWFPSGKTCLLYAQNFKISFQLSITHKLLIPNRNWIYMRRIQSLLPAGCINNTKSL